LKKEVLVMRPKFKLRAARPVYVAAGATLLAIPATAVALSTGSADAQSALSFNLARHRIAYGGRVIATGSASSVNPGSSLSLQFAPASSNSWRTVATATVDASGHFRLTTQLRRSGLLRIVTAAGGSVSNALDTSSTATTTGVAPSGALPITVGARLLVTKHGRDVLAGQHAVVVGKLLPGAARRRVRLEVGLGHGRWRTLASTRTGPAGGFRFGYPAASTGQQRLFVGFAGDRQNAKTIAPAGVLTVYRMSLASWYSDGGNTACGFHSYYGVANKWLPCGTKVAFHYGGRTVTAVVDDRGPFVGGREWDLNQNTAGALGFGGVDTVWSSI
jgi:hypothetical protein